MKILEAYSHHSGAVWVFFRYGNKKESWVTKIDSTERHDSSNISCMRPALVALAGSGGA